VREKLESLIEEMLDRGIVYEDAKREFERRFIQRALARSRGNITRATELLGLHRNTLSRKMIEYRMKKTG
jgi:DNA-binding NtrC family response regulator